MEVQSNSLFSHQSQAASGGKSIPENDAYLKKVVIAAEEKLKEEIAKNFDITKLFNSSKSIRIADVGCSSGSTTVLAVENIIDAIKSKYKSQGLVEDQTPEFEVFFNDLESNDFNTLFTFLPPNREYFAAALPGSFYKPLLPKQSIHIVHSSSSLNWLSEIPKEVRDPNSPAFNKGKIHYVNAHKDVMEAYAAQYDKDWNTFLCARAQDVVVGGLMALSVPAVSDVKLSLDTHTGRNFLILESCLTDMTKLGVISEEQLDSFNLGLYHSSPEELIEIIERNGMFSIESMAKIVDGFNAKATPVEKRALVLKAGIGGIFKRHFRNDEIIDEVFDRFAKKVTDSPLNLQCTDHKMVIFLLLKRKP
ncbi:loganic acid O-methyltransferase-like [Ziziphus jujuba]|uniref:Loganic acid O-methyltransferase-like n=1 Tax=Ziziphus jujuba TaxID=326968 RepID=A0ABM3ZYY4_ZIZJJ|nr:loganic acid O-methyltransferase-like [Ziziphus jujuba]